MSCTSRRPRRWSVRRRCERERSRLEREKDAIAATDRQLPVHRPASARCCRASCATGSASTTPACCRATAGWSRHLAQAGLLKVICGTDTLGVGINVPDPDRAVHGAVEVRRHEDAGCCRLASSTRSPVAPVAPGSTPSATVVVQAPEHVIENEKALAKAGDDERKRRKVVRKKPPEGIVVVGPADVRAPESRPSRSRSSRASASRHAMLLNVIARPGNAFEAMRHLLTDNHEDRARAAAAHPSGDRDLPRAASPAAWWNG